MQRFRMQGRSGSGTVHQLPSPEGRSLGGAPAANPCVVSIHVRHYRFCYRPCDLSFVVRITNVRSLGPVGAEADLDQHSWHECTAQDGEVGLLNAAIRTGVEGSESRLDLLSEIRALAQVLVLRHVVENEVERIALLRIRIGGLEAHGF